MASERKTGLGTLPAGLLRPTTTPEPEKPAASINDDAPDPAEADQGRAAAPAEKPARTRRRPPVGGETKGRKLHLPDGIHDRLWLLARQRRTTVSAVAADLLEGATEVPGRAGGLRAGGDGRAYRRTGPPWRAVYLRHAGTRPS